MRDVELRSIVPKDNRYRVYGLTEASTLFGEPCLIIAWGRLGQPLRRRTETFASEEARERRFRALLKRRMRHGYAVRAELGSPA